MGLFLVKHGARKKYYMQDGHEDIEDVDLVEADSEEEAEGKINKMYEDKDDPYGDYYTGVYAHVKPVIR